MTPYTARKAMPLALLLGLLVLLGACQSAPPTAGAVATPVTMTAPVPTITPTRSPKVNLTISCRCVRDGANHSIIIWLQDSVIPAFVQRMRAEGRPFTIQVNGITGTDEALKATYLEELPAGRGPDLMLMDGFWIPEFVAAGLLKPLDEIVGPRATEWDGWEHVSPGLRGLLSYQGELYGIALGTDTRAIFYRRDLFEKAGLPVPWEPRSWEDILDAARTLKTALPDVTPLQLNGGSAMGEATTMQGYLMLLLGAGSHMYDFSQDKWVVRSPAILETLRFYQTLYGEERLGEPAFQLGAEGREDSFAAFQQGKLAMLVESDFFWRAVLAPRAPWELEGRNELVGWAKMPAMRPGAGYNRQDYVTISGGTGVALNPNSVHPQDAWDFLAFMFSAEMLTEFQKVEPRLRVRNDVMVPGEPVLTDMSRALLPLTTVRPTLPEYPRISEEAQRMTERVITGEMTPEEAMESYALAVEGIVGAENTISLP